MCSTLGEKGGEEADEAIEAGVASDAFVGVAIERDVEGFSCEGVRGEFCGKGEVGIWLLSVETPMENGYQWSRFGVEVVDGIFVSLVNGNSSSINIT